MIRGCGCGRTRSATAATSSPNPAATPSSPRQSRRYSVTFGQLRRARAEHRRLERYGDGVRDPWGRPLDDTIVLVVNDWTYAGRGYAPRTPAHSSPSHPPTGHADASHRPTAA